MTLVRQNPASGEARCSRGLVLFEIHSGRRLFQHAERTAALTERRELYLSEQPELYKLSPQVRDD